MDNKITKSRLKNFLTYDLIKAVVVAAIVCAVLLLFFTTFAKRPTDGQNFYLMCSGDLYVNSDFDDILTNTKDGSSRFKFSYDILEANKITCQETGSYSQSYMLSVYSATYEDDIFLCANNYVEDDEESECIFKSFVSGSLASIIYSDDGNNFVDNAIAYAKKFYNGDVIDEEKVRDNFIKKYGKDTRFTKSEDFEQGVQDEMQRIKNVYEYATILKQVFINHPDLLFNYTLGYSEENEYNFVGNYAINLSKLNGKNGMEIKNYLSCNQNTEDVQYDIMLCVGNLASIDGDLYYEALAYINNVIDTFSTYIDEVVL